ncbi:unnamed protein product [Heligmosomoides polygyrus]|uniref:Anoctamin n=1 Tax=Heligmosomoides polygyrus TaxID=6339 RepID=A0A183FMM2_HELPZ|nr:unnamed protein product [Heligmosomoides polygyrus]
MAPCPHRAEGPESRGIHCNLAESYVQAIVVAYLLQPDAFVMLAPAVLMMVCRVLEASPCTFSNFQMARSEMDESGRYSSSKYLVSCAEFATKTAA